jgi:hypothetical protein
MARHPRNALARPHLFQLRSIVMLGGNIAAVYSILRLPLD